MGNNRYDKLKASFEALQPQLPTDFTRRVMKRVEQKIASQSVAKTRKRWRWLSVAASLLLLIGIGLTVMPKQEQGITEPLIVQQVRETPVRKERTPSPKGADSQSERSGLPVRKERTPSKQPSFKQSKATFKEVTPTPTANNEHLHYVAQIQTEDSVPYQVPSRMDEFIAKLAEYNKVKGTTLDCNSGSSDSTIVGTAYVFEDKSELDLFAKLLQVACWYDTKTPGYLLNFSHQQFFFCLKDPRKGQKYLWVAERIGGNRILLYSTHSPIEATVSSVCFQDYREQLLHKGINTKDIDI